MKKAIMNVSRFSNEDVIATSGFQYATAFTLSNFGNSTANDGSISFNNGVSKSFSALTSEADFESLFSDNINLGGATVNGIKWQDGSIEANRTLMLLYYGETGGANNSSGLNDTFTWDSSTGYFIANALK